jgi:hypothetical protein
MSVSVPYAHVFRWRVLQSIGLSVLLVLGVASGRVYAHYGYLGVNDLGCSDPNNPVVHFHAESVEYDIDTLDELTWT